FLSALRNLHDGQRFEIADVLAGERLRLAPLTVGAIHALLAERLALSIPRSVLLRVHEASPGNPLVGRKLGGGLQDRGLPEPGRPFDVATDAEALFAARLDRLSPPTLDALALGAATATPTLSLLDELSAGRVEPAVEAGVIRLDGERIHFMHPLLASATYAR